MRRLSYLFVLLGFCLTSVGAQGLPPLDAYLTSGSLAEGERVFTQRLAQNPDDETAFSLGVLQFLGAVGGLSQAGYRYGLRAEQGRDFGLPILRLPTPFNPNPENISYADFRRVLETFLDDLAEAEATLARVQGEVELPIRFGLIRLDLDGDGVATEEERFWNLYTRYNARAAGLDEGAGEVHIVFDTGDVHWLRGYSHLLMATLEFYLAHDGQELFERTAGLFYPNVDTPHSMLQEPSDASLQGFDPALIADVVTLIHLVSLEVAEPERMAAALAHLEAVLEQSRASWEDILAETDNEREWIPNPEQESVVPVAVSSDMVAGWLMFLDEAEALLKGTKLVPHWRVRDGRGVNLRRVFLEPQRFDLVLWLQGSGATPFLEEGELTTGETWRRLQDVFGGNFIGFALWFN